MHFYKFAVQPGRIIGPNMTPGPEIATTVSLRKSSQASDGVDFAAAKAGCLATLRGQERHVQQHPRELAVLQGLIGHVDALDEAQADLLPEGTHSHF